jgi:hypothetical protein
MISRIALILLAAAALAGCASTEMPPPSSDPGPRLSSLGSQPYWIGHRVYRENAMAWGWVKRAGDPWSKAQLVVIREEKAAAPHRSLGSLAADDSHEYRLYGSIWGRKAYDPVLNRYLEVLDLERYEPLGRQPSIRRPLYSAIPGNDGWRRVRNVGSAPSSGYARSYEDIEAQL